jgi:hypothetical protein
MADILSKTSGDHPNIVIFPPVILATTVVLGCMLQWLLPLGVLAGIG